MLKLAKKLICLISIITVLLLNCTVFAENIPKVTASISGKIATNENIKIVIAINNIDSFYAGDMKFKYNNQVLKVTGIEKGDLITKSGINSFDAGTNIDDANGIAEYKGFSCLGKINGFSGSGTYLTIDAQVLKLDSFYVNCKPLNKILDLKNNLVIDLYDKNVNSVNYDYTGIDFKVNNDKTEGTIIKTDSSVKSVSGSTVASGSLDNNTIAQNNTNTNTGTGKNDKSSVNSAQNLSGSTIDNASKAENSSPDGEGPSGKAAKGSSKSNKYNSAGKVRVVYGIAGIAIVIILAVIVYFRKNLIRFLLKKKK